MKKLLAVAALFTLNPVQAQAPQLGVAPASQTACPASHPVKGNIVSRGDHKGEKIYHLPGSRSYNQTHPERCFKNTQEAQKAGYRAPKR